MNVPSFINFPFRMVHSAPVGFHVEVLSLAEMLKVVVSDG